MGGSAAAITLNSRSSQWPEITCAACGRMPICRGMSCSDRARQSYMQPDRSIMYGQGPPPCEIK